MSSTNPPSHTAKLDRILADASATGNGLPRQSPENVPPRVRPLRP